MIDYIMAFTNEAAAKADPAVGAYFVNGAWRGDCVIAGLQSWNPANDTTQQIPGPGGGTVPSTVHAFASGWWCLIATAARVPALEADNNFVVCLDRDAAAGGALPAAYIKAFSPTLFPNVLSLINTCRFQPVFAGSKYPALGVA